jgi:PAS domain S-box-containing protein
MTTDVLLTVLKNDLLANILAHAANLEACASFISLQLREIIAARLVALCERLPSGEYRPVAVCPERRTALLGEDGYRRLIHLAATCDEPTMLVPGEEEPGRLLAALGLKQSFVVPLSVEKENYGLLLLLDIMDDRGLHHILEDLRSISGLLSLVFKTSYLYRNMERLVVARSDALLASEARAAQILQTAMDGFWCLDANGRITEVNDAYCQMSGYSRDELMAMSIGHLEIGHPPVTIDANVQNILAGEHLRFEGQHRRKDGSSFDVEVSVQRRHGHSGEMFAFIRDISAQKHNEAEREQLQRRLQQAQKMEAIGTLAGGIAHDFNNILGAVIGYAEIALDVAPPGSRSPTTSPRSSRPAIAPRS